jgi:DNA invertase Pin-like site-specific DNA recombinase
VLYLRVSTPSQVKTDYDPEGISIPAQRDACSRKAAQMGVEIIDEYVEPGRTATSMDKRPAFQEMLARIKKQRDVDYVIVYKLSRMNRNRIDDALVLASLRKYNATLVSATESIDATPVGQLMHGILAAFNEYRSAEDGADIRYKMGEKAKKGGTLGRAPLGYLNVRERFEGREVRTVVPDPERAPFVILAFELYATGEYSLRRLVEELTDRGLRTRPGRYPASPLSDSKLNTMLRDPYYLGMVTYQGAQYPGRHQPLVSQDLFDRVQAILDAHATAGERQRVHNHYLKGTLWCGRCRDRGRVTRLVLTKATGRRGTEYFYFKCRGTQEGFCDLPHLPVPHVEDEILRHWYTERLSEAFITATEACVSVTLAEHQASAHLLHEQLAAELVKLDRQEENLLDLLADPDLDTTKIRTRLTKLQAQRKTLTTRRGDNDEHLRRGAAVLQVQLDLLRNPGELYRQLPDAARRQLNQAFYERLYVDDDGGDIQVTAQDYTRETTGLVEAAQAWGQTAVSEPHKAEVMEGDPKAPDGPQGPAEDDVTYFRQKAIRPTVAGGPDLGLVAGSLRPLPNGKGWSKPAMVELRGLEPLTPSMPSTGQGCGVGRLSRWARGGGPSRAVLGARVAVLPCCTDGGRTSPTCHDKDRRLQAHPRALPLATSPEGPGIAQ